MFLHAVKSIFKLNQKTEKRLKENKHQRNDVFFSADKASATSGRKKLMTFFGRKSERTCKHLNRLLFSWKRKIMTEGENWLRTFAGLRKHYTKTFLIFTFKKKFIVLCSSLIFSSAYRFAIKLSFKYFHFWIFQFWIRFFALGSNLYFAFHPTPKQH